VQLFVPIDVRFFIVRSNASKSSHESPTVTLIVFVPWGAMASFQVTVVEARDFKLMDSGSTSLCGVFDLCCE
jgi:hypothetical protein